MTETEELAQILDEAARRWPGLSRAKLIQRVVVDWAAGGRAPSERARARRSLVGSLPGSSELYDRERDWPG